MTASLPPDGARQRTSLLLQAAHDFLAACIQPGDFTLDGTVGNGHDTRFLARCAGPAGRVYGFDIQAAALGATGERLRAEGLEAQVTLFHTGHEHLDAVLPIEARHGLRAAMFNLGYLPGGAHVLTTQGASTVAALNQTLTHLLPGGRISVMLYPGHAGGPAEGAAVTAWAAGLDRRAYQVLHTRLLNQGEDAPQLLLVAHRQAGC